MRPPKPQRVEVSVLPTGRGRVTIWAVKCTGCGPVNGRCRSKRQGEREGGEHARSHGSHARLRVLR